MAIRGNRNQNTEGQTKHGMLDICIPLINHRLHVIASFLEYSRLGNDRRQRLSSDFVTQVAATFGDVHSHTDATTTCTGSWKGTVIECTPQAVCPRRYYTARITRTTMVDQSDKKSTVHSYIPNTHFFWNFLVTSFKKPRNLLDTSRLFRIFPDPSPTYRSSPNGLIGTCVGYDSPCATVLARRLIGTCTGPVQTARSSQLLPR